jgi:hypothetical protein
MKARMTPEQRARFDEALKTRQGEQVRQGQERGQQPSETAPNRQGPRLTDPAEYAQATRTLGAAPRPTDPAELAAMSPQQRARYDDLSQRPLYVQVGVALEQQTDRVNQARRQPELKRGEVDALLSGRTIVRAGQEPATPIVEPSRHEFRPPSEPTRRPDIAQPGIGYGTGSASRAVTQSSVRTLERTPDQAPRVTIQHGEGVGGGPQSPRPVYRFVPAISVTEEIKTRMTPEQRQHYDSWREGMPGTCKNRAIALSSLRSAWKRRGGRGRNSKGPRTLCPATADKGLCRAVVAAAAAARRGTGSRAA